MRDGGHKIRSNQRSIEDYDYSEEEEDSGESWEDSSESSEECEDCEDWSDGSSIEDDKCLYLNTPPTARYNIKASYSHLSNNRGGWNKRVGVQKL